MWSAPACVSYIPNKCSPPPQLILTTSIVAAADSGSKSNQTLARVGPEVGPIATPPIQASPAASPSPTINPATLPPESVKPLPPTVTNCGTIYAGSVVNEYISLSTDVELQCQCFSQLNAWLSTSDQPTRTLTTLIGKVTTFTTTGTDEKATVTSSVTISTSEFLVTSNFLGVTTDLWIGSASSPCCYSCTIAASTVQVLFFPEETSKPGDPVPVTSFVSNGVTFQSPSVYIGFTSLSAYDYCGPIGKNFVNTTLAFEPSELSSIVYGTFAGSTFTFITTGPDGIATPTIKTPIVYQPTGSAAVNYADLVQNCSTIAGYTYVPGLPFNNFAASRTFFLRVLNRLTHADLEQQPIRATPPL